RSRSRLGRHGTTLLGTPSASCGASLAMLVVVGAALFRAPFTDLGTNLTIGRGELASPRLRLGTEQADVDALAAAVGAIVVAHFANHRLEATLAGDGTFLAGFDTRIVI